MRWNAAATTGGPMRFNGEIAAVPVTLLSRDEDVHYHHHQHYSLAHTQRRSGQHTTARRAVLPSKTLSRPTAPPAKLPDQRRPWITTPNETIRLSTTVMTTPRTEKETQPLALPVSARVLTPRTEGQSAQPPLSGESLPDGVHATFLVCAGRAMSAESPRSNNDSHAEDDLPAATAAVVSLPVAAAPETPRSLRPGLQRSDSELELIISELREKIGLQQHRSQSPQTDDEGNGSSSSSGSRSNHHSRKHLKNPVEKMSLASSASSTGIQLRRQASASQVHATRLVREGSATTVTPVVLASSASRSMLAHGATTGSGTQVSTTRLSLPPDVSVDANTDGVTEPSEGFRIRAYASGSDGYTNPLFTSSTSLGQNLPTSLPSPLRVTSPVTAEVTTIVHSSALRSTKPRVRTLVDLDVELDRLYDIGDGGDLSPVGPWVLHQDEAGPLASSRSTASLGTSVSLTDLMLTSSTADPAAELSPRSRLLWLSDCCSDDGWATAPSVRVMAMLRPGSQLHGRPASATELRRRPSKAKSGSTPGKSRATSAKAYAATGSRRSSGEAAASHQATVGKQPIVKTPAVRVAQRPRSGSGSSTNSSGSSASGRMLIAQQRASFRT